MTKKTKTLIIRFQNQLNGREVEFFRGAVINELNDKEILFHNHLPNNEGYRYSYPLIQYKRISGRAAIFCIGPGTDAIGKFFFDSDMELRIGNRKESFEVDNINAYRTAIGIEEGLTRYSISNWLALNHNNYARYNRLESISEKSTFLEQILIGNILSLAKGLDLFLDRQVECKLTQLSEPGTTLYKGTKLTVFDAEFLTNMVLPDYIGLGKGVSIGYGTTTIKQ